LSKPLNYCLQVGNVDLNRVPHQLQINTKVVVNELVAHLRDLRPGNARLRLKKGRRHTLDGRADDLELANHGVLDQGGVSKCRFVDVYEINLDPANSLEDVAEIKRIKRRAHRSRGLPEERGHA
jgi:hypothetical protein